MIEYPVKCRAISLLAKIRQSLMSDENGSLSLKIADCGKYVASDLIADTISAILRTEQQCYKALDALDMEREENAAYFKLLGDRVPDDLTYAQKEELSDLVQKWDKVERETDE